MSGTSETFEASVIESPDSSSIRSPESSGQRSPIPVPDTKIPSQARVSRYHLNKLINDERDFFVECHLKKRWYYLNFDVFPIATCYPPGYHNMELKRIYKIPRYSQKGRDTFASIQQEVATIQAHESAGWIYVDAAAKERNSIMAFYTSLLEALDKRQNLGLGEEFWGYKLYTYGLP